MLGILKKMFRRQALLLQLMVELTYFILESHPNMIPVETRYSVENAVSKLEVELEG